MLRLFFLLLVTTFAFASERKFTEGCKMADGAEAFCEDGLSHLSLPDDDVVEVVLLRAPLFKAKLGPVLAKFDLYHAGVGFISKKTGRSYDVDFVAVFDMVASVYPNYTSSGQELWCNDGASCMHNRLRNDYWDYYDHVTALTGAQFNELEVWLRDFNNTYTTYELFTVKQGKDAPVDIMAHTCFEFAWQVFNKIYDLGGRFSPDEVLSKNVVNLFASSIEKVDMTITANIKAVAEFYAEMANHSGSPEEFISFYRDLVELPKYLYHEKAYYKLQDMVAPFINYDFARSPLPGQHISF